jgi:aminomethyltransferase
LEGRHVDLGAGLADWNDMAVAWTYATSVDEEHAAVREAAGLFDFTALKKVHVTGPEALATVDYLLPRDMNAVAVGRAVYSTILNDDGGIDDDAIIYRLADDHFMVVFGTGDTEKQVEKASKGRNVSCELDDDLHCISLQGPIAVDFLNEHTPMDLLAMKYFGVEHTSLFGHDVILARTGYSGERGYGIFVPAAAAGDIWDQILEKGYSRGIRASCFVCLNTIRIESGLLFYPFDMTAEHTPWEVGLGWTVSTTKAADFIGKAKVLERKGNERIQLVGILADHDAAVGEPIAGGEKVSCNGHEVGKITASLWSNRLKQSISFAHVDPSVATEGTDLMVQGADCAIGGKVVPLPFYDPDKTRPRA